MQATTPSAKPTQRVLLALCGGVAAFKICELSRLLTASGREVKVVMTASAQRFIGTATMQALTNNPVITDAWDTNFSGGMAHIDLPRWADVILVAPASANRLAQFAHGLAEDLLGTLVLARDVPLICVPAMNKQMWSHPATQRNVAQLQADGVSFFGPASGAQACGEVGEGRMLEASEIFAALEAWAQPKSLAGKRVLLTAGPTQEAIDPVRVLTNLSSGKMGFALAQACHEAGASVSLVAGPTSLATPYGVNRHDVRSAAEMLATVQSQVADTDIFIAVAAVADYTPAAPSEQKIKKSSDSLNIALTPTVDILSAVASQAKTPFCVGFAAETNDVIAYATAKRLKKNIPLIVANQAQTALGSDNNTITLIDANGVHPLPAADKLTLARSIVAHIASLHT
jgi:phosphopantothenoylcysteine decarboxylase / phosphopantothenate---cysteine ligase